MELANEIVNELLVCIGAGITVTWVSFAVGALALYKLADKMSE